MTFKPGDFVYYAVDYFSRPEGRTIYLHFERCNEEQERDLVFKQVQHYSKSRFYINPVEYQEDDFFSMYGFLVPESIFVQVKRRQAPNLSFKQEYHFRYT